MFKDSIIDRLRQKGLKITPQRAAIIGVLAGQRHLHPSARLVFEKARETNSRLSLSTVYATLDGLSSLGLIKTLRFDGMENRYDGNVEEHANLICSRCRTILDYQAPLSLDQGEVEKKTGFSITDSRIEYYGLCRECRKNAGRKRGRRIHDGLKREGRIPEAPIK